MENCSFQCAAMIEFDQATYTVMEGDLNSTVDVCVTVGNGRVVDSLTVSINLLPTSTATGQGSMFSASLGLHGGQLLWLPSDVKSHRKANIWELRIIENGPQSVLYWRFYCIADPYEKFLHRSIFVAKEHLCTYHY